jgi:hypothetical protein
LPWRDRVHHEPAISTRKNGRNSAALDCGERNANGGQRMRRAGAVKNG